ncbi:lytic transglycosylase domain-containing protein [Thermoflexus sp.]|uniref:lytic transglycosylase domain-containing protein n=1 Tax=Thermoflexus sp. TaxID=1969742 RepID=UPI002ADD7F26|nr:lytic transglycosylase domain-containing protein [Thermoflexus sp.]
MANFRGMDGDRHGTPAALSRMRVLLSILSILFAASVFIPILLRIPPPAPLFDPSIRTIVPSGGSSGHPMAGRGLAPLFTPEVMRWSDRILRWADEHGLNPNLIATVMQIESCGDPQALSPRGAIGLFQVMPFHFRDGDDPWHPDVNARAGLSYLSRLLRIARGDVAQAMAGYHGGPSAIGRPERWGNETRRYVRWGTGIYADAVRGADRSETLEQWLRSGGRGLCEQAAKRVIR